MIGSEAVSQTVPAELEAAERDQPGSSTNEPQSRSDAGSDEPAEAPTDESTAPVDWSSCRRVTVDSSSKVAAPGLLETSGLAASEQHDGVLWAHNDSGSEAGVFAVGLDGSDRGFFGLDGITGVDVEDMALVDGRIYLADFGDNGNRRSAIEIFIFDEPIPDPPGSAGSAGSEPSAETPTKTIAEVTTIRLFYPDGPTDAEGFLVDPITDEILILSKDLNDGDAPTRIYSVPSPTALIAATASGGPTEPVELALVGMLDVAGLNSQATEFSLNAVLFPGLVTATDVSNDGRLIALRTYGTVWLFKRSPEQSMVGALAGDPCEGGTAAESQGEAVAFLPPTISEDDRADGTSGNVRYVTIGEGTNPAVNVVTVELQ